MTEIIFVMDEKADVNLMQGERVSSWEARGGVMPAAWLFRTISSER